MKRIVILHVTLMLFAQMTFGQNTGYIGLEQIHPAGSPNSSSINFIIMGDGYRDASGEVGTPGSFFENHALTIKEELVTNVTPFAEYSDYFNVYKVDVGSEDQGIDHPCLAPGEVAGGCVVEDYTTYFDLSYDAEETQGSGDYLHRLVDLDPTSVAAILAQAGPSIQDYDPATTFVIVLANCENGLFDPNSLVHWLGSGDWINQLALAPGAGGFVNDEQITIHELGHAFAFLQDEYWAGGNFTSEAPNRHYDAGANPICDDMTWSHWCGIEGIGIHAHAPYPGGPSDGIANWYKPTEDACMMEWVDDPLCAVCREAVILRVHGLVDPIETATPDPAPPIQMTSSEDFHLDLRYPDPNTLEVVWTLNGTVIASGNDIEDVTLNCADMISGENVLEVVVRDHTDAAGDFSTVVAPWVRHPDPAINDYNTKTITWTINAQEDLWIADRTSDVGSEDLGTPVSWPLDLAPGIWITNTQGSLVNELPDYNLNTVYTYTEVSNKGCAASGSGRTLEMHYTPSSTGSDEWSIAFTYIGTANIPSLPPGQISIPIEIEWQIGNVPPEDIPPTEDLCLLARVVPSGSIDPETPYSDYGNLSGFIFYNNNVAHRNTKVINVPEMGFVSLDGIKLPPGGSLISGNTGNHPDVFDLTFSISDQHTGKPLTDEAEVYMYIKDSGWDISTVIKDSDVEGMKKLAPRYYQITNDMAAINNIPFPAKTSVEIYIGYSFLTKEVEANPFFQYDVRQMRSSDDYPIGAVHYDIIRDPRYLFTADADDKEADKDAIVDLKAEDIGEDAVYNWYDMDGNLVFTGKDLSVTADITKKYKLEVIAEVDGYKDYKEVEVKVKMGEIIGISPNPATANQTVVSYHTQGGSSAYLAVFNVATGGSDQYILNLRETSITLDLSNYQAGNYEVLLVTDGVVRDTESLLVQ